MEIEGTSSEIFYRYLEAFSEHKPQELKVIIIDNAGFHSLKDYQLPSNIKLIRIPPYSPELNPAEKIWAYIKQRYKNECFENIHEVKKWLHDFIKTNLDNKIVKSITNTQYYESSYIGKLVS